MTDREIVELVNQCGKRVCSTDEHFGCPFGDEGMVDCAERLGAAYDDAIERLLTKSETLSTENERLKKRLEEAEKYIPHCCECCEHQRAYGACAQLPEGDVFSLDCTEGFNRDDCEHWELRAPQK